MVLDHLALSLSGWSSRSGLGEAFWELEGLEAVAWDREQLLHPLCSPQVWSGPPTRMVPAAAINYEAFLALCFRLKAERRPSFYLFICS